MDTKGAVKEGEQGRRDNKGIKRIEIQSSRQNKKNERKEK